MFKKRLQSFKYAGAGLVDLLSNTPNAKIHFALAILVLILSYYFELDKLEWCLIILCITLVFAAEAFNTGLEYLTDLVTSEYHDLAKKAKDVAAAAVLITAIGSLIIGLIIFLPKIKALF